MKRDTRYCVVTTELLAGVDVRGGVARRMSDGGNYRGFTLIEAVMSMLVVGLMLVAAMNTVGASKITQSRTTEQAVGSMLAEDLMSEILSQYYQEPIDTPGFGRESESGGNRIQWDDVDDYVGWSSSPPENKDGTAIPDLNGWARKVSVYWVSTNNLNQQTATPGGIKRIDVKVIHQGREVAQLSALRTLGWPDP